MGIIAWIIIGIVAGWLAEQIMGRNHGLLTNLIVGVVGALIGGFLANNLLGVDAAGNWIVGVIVATIGAVVLLFQALLLAHGGLTTLGANIFSMAIVGPFVAYGLFRLSRALGASLAVGVFLAASLADLLTYVTTSVQLSMAFPDPVGGFAASFAKFAGIFAVTQIPLAISEGLLTVLIFNALARYNARELHAMNLTTASEVRT